MYIVPACAGLMMANDTQHQNGNKTKRGDAEAAKISLFFNLVFLCDLGTLCVKFSSIFCPG